MVGIESGDRQRAVLLDQRLQALRRPAPYFVGCRRLGRGDKLDHRFGGCGDGARCHSLCCHGRWGGRNQFAQQALASLLSGDRVFAEVGIPDAAFGLREGDKVLTAWLVEPEFRRSEHDGLLVEPLPVVPQVVATRASYLAGWYGAFLHCERRALPTELPPHKQVVRAAVGRPKGGSIERGRAVVTRWEWKPLAGRLHRSPPPVHGTGRGRKKTRRGAAGYQRPAYAFEDVFSTSHPE